MYFTIVATDGSVAWFGLGSFYSIFLDSSSRSTLEGADVWYSTLGSLELFLVRRYGGGGQSISVWDLSICIKNISEFPYCFELVVPQLKGWFWISCLQGLCYIWSSTNGHISWTVVRNFQKYQEESYSILFSLPFSVSIVVGIASIKMDFWSKEPSIYWVGIIDELPMGFLLNLYLESQWC